MKEKEITTLSGQKASILGLGSNLQMESECINLAYQNKINYFFFYNLKSTHLISQMNQLCENKSDRENIIIATGSESRDLQELEAYRIDFCQQLNIKTIDIFLLEYVYPQDNIEEVESLLEQLLQWKQKGLIRYLGISTHNRELAVHFLDTGKIDLLMHRYNMAHRQAETVVFPIATQHDIPIVSFTATRWGSLLKGHDKWDLPIPSALDCYRFVLQNSAVRLTLTSPKTTAELMANLAVFKYSKMNDIEYQNWQKYGDLIYDRGQDSFETQWQ